MIHIGDLFSTTSSITFESESFCILTPNDSDLEWPILVFRVGKHKLCFDRYKNGALYANPNIQKINVI